MTGPCSRQERLQNGCLHLEHQRLKGNSRCCPHPGPHCSRWTRDPESRRCCGSTQATTRRVERLGWLLIRNYNDEIGASIAEAFGTDDRRAVESYCRANAIKFEWQPDGALRTWQRRSAVVHHSRTGQRCWFNQIAFLNEWTIDPEVREYLVDVYGENGLPFNTRFGNGDAIGADVVQLINEVYEGNTAREQWQSGDLMLVDNIRTAHGRECFEGSRDVLVAMA